MNDAVSISDVCREQRERLATSVPCHAWEAWMAVIGTSLHLVAAR